MIRKIKQQNGETLIESMLAMLIAVLSVALLSSAVAAAARINQANRTSDEKFNQELQQAEGFLGTPTTPKVKVHFSTGEIQEATVNVYGGDGRFISYDYNP